MIHIDEQGLCYWQGDSAKLVGYSSEDKIARLEILEGFRRGISIDQPLVSIRDKTGAIIGEDAIADILHNAIEA